MSYFKPGGGIAASERFGTEQMCVLSVDESGQLNVSWVINQGPWQGPITIGPVGLTVAGANLATSQQFGANQTDVFLFDKNGQLNVFWIEAALGWNGPSTIGKTGAANPGDHLAACAQLGGNQTDVFFIDRNGQMNVAWVDGEGAWSGPETLGPSGLAPAGAPVAAIQQSGTQRTSVFVVDKNGQLNAFWVDGFGSWSGPNKLGPAGLTVAGAHLTAYQQFGGTQTDVFLFDSNGQLNVFWQDGTGNWQGPEKLGTAGFANSGDHLVAIQQFGLQQTDVLALDKSGALHVYWVDGFGNWQGPEAIGGTASLLTNSGIAASQQGSANQTDIVLIDKNGKLNIFWVDGNNPWNGPTVREDPVSAPPNGYQGSANYIVANGSSCATLTGVQATIYVTEDLVWQSSQDTSTKNFGQGFSIQLNAETKNGDWLTWLQFVVTLQGTSLQSWINLWSGSNNNANLVWDPPENNLATMPQAGRIPAGYTIIIALQNDNSGNVTSATWKVTDNTGREVGSNSQSLAKPSGGIAANDLSPVASFQVTFGGDDNGSHATFSSGAGLVILAADQTMTVDTAYPTCIGFISGTAETSNIAYGELCATPSMMFSQAFSVAPDSASARLTKPGARSLPHRTGK